MAVLMKWNYDKHDYDMKRIPDGMNCVCESCYEAELELRRKYRD